MFFRALCDDVGLIHFAKSFPFKIYHQLPHNFQFSKAVFQLTSTCAHIQCHQASITSWQNARSHISFIRLLHSWKSPRTPPGKTSRAARIHQSIKDPSERKPIEQREKSAVDTARYLRSGGARDSPRPGPRRVGAARKRKAYLHRARSYNVAVMYTKYTRAYIYHASA